MIREHAIADGRIRPPSDTAQRFDAPTLRMRKGERQKFEAAARLAEEERYEAARLRNEMLKGGSDALP